MALFLLKTKLTILMFTTLAFLSCADSNHCFYNSDCAKEQSCLSSKCTAWQCRNNNDCDKGIRVCDRTSHTCRKCSAHWDCGNGLYCLNGLCDASNPTCVNNGILEVCKGCKEGSECPDGMSCKRYRPDSDKLICKR